MNNNLKTKENKFRKALGFSLIELLGVIIILSAMSTVTVLTVDNSIKRAKVRSCENQENNIIQAARMYITDHPTKANKNIKLSDLMNNGYLETDIRNPMTGNHYKNDTFVRVIVDIDNYKPKYKYHLVYGTDDISCTHYSPGPTPTNNTYTATFYYQSSSTSGTTNIKSTTASCSAESNGKCTVSIPTVVKESGGTYNNAYSGLNTSTNNMDAKISGNELAITLSKNEDYYALYRTKILVYYPTSTTEVSNRKLYQNQWFTSKTAMANTVLTTTTTGMTTNAKASLAVPEYNTLVGFTTSVGNNSADYPSIAELTKINSSKNTSLTVYEINKKTENTEATFYYSNSNTGAKTSSKASGNATTILKPISNQKATTITSQGNISAPTTIAPYGTRLLGWAASESTMDITTEFSNNGTYYAVYGGTSITNYYYNGSNYTSRNLYRNGYYGSAENYTMVLSTDSSGTSDYSTASGPGSSQWYGLSTGQDITREYSSVGNNSGAAYSTATSLYTIYKFNVIYEKGSGVSAIESTSGACYITTSSTSCNVILPSITPNSGYVSAGWNTTSGALTGTKAGNNYSINSNNTKLYANAFDDTITLSIASSSTTKSITVVATASAVSGITKYEFSKDGGKTWIANGTNNTYTFTGLKQNTSYPIKVRVTSGTGKTKIEPSANLKTIDDLKNSPGPSDDPVEENRYVYTGANPDNFICLDDNSSGACEDDKMYRIIAIEPDGTLKVIKYYPLRWSTYDYGSYESDTNISSRYIDMTYTLRFADVFCSSDRYGCSVWSSRTSTYDSKGNKKIKEIPEEAGGIAMFLPKYDAYLNVYLNGGEYPGLTTDGWINNQSNSDSMSTTIRNNITEHLFNINSAFASENQTLATDVANVKTYTWKGKAGLPDITDYVRANSNTSTCGTVYLSSNNASTCKSTTWLPQSTWTTTFYDDDDVYLGLSKSGASGCQYCSTGLVRPAFFLKSSIILTGNGTNDENVYRIYDGNTPTVGLDKPTFSEELISSGKNVTITYPDGCTNYTCKYSTNGGASWTNVTTNTKTIAFTNDGYLLAKVSDGTNEVNSSYTVTITVQKTDIDGLKLLEVTTGDGLYEDPVEENRYVYKGSNPDNYICLDTNSSGTCLNNDLYRIISIETDGTLKVVKARRINIRSVDLEYTESVISSRAADSIAGTRYSSSINDYCYGLSESDYDGCDIWGNKTNIYDSTGTTKVTKMPRYIGGSYTNLPTYNAYANVYLNGGIYPTADGTTTITGWLEKRNDTIKNNVVEHLFNVGLLEKNSGQTLATDVSQEAAYKWKGNVGLMATTDYVRANSNIANCGTVYLNTIDSGNYATCKTTNWLAGFQENFMIPVAGSLSDVLWSADSNGALRADIILHVFSSGSPTFFLRPNIKLIGSGTNDDNVYRIYDGSMFGELEAPTFTEKDTSTGKDVTITYPNGCSKYTCQYSTNGGTTWTTVISNTKTIPFTSSGTLIARVNSEINQTSSTYTVTINAASKLRSTVVTSGCGLYADSEEEGRYIYRGGSNCTSGAVNNYICLDTKNSGKCSDYDLYRIISVESDGTLKVIKNSSLVNMILDSGKVIGGNLGTGYTNGSYYMTRYSENSTDYCLGGGIYMGCRIWGDSSSIYDRTGTTKITQMPREIGESTTYTLPTYSAYLNVFLNGGKYLAADSYGNSSTYQTITGWLESQNGDIKNNIVEHFFNMGLVGFVEGESISTSVQNEAAYKWKGKVGLMNVTDYIRATINPNCDGIRAYTYTEDCYNNSAAQNWLFNSKYDWTMTPYSSSYVHYGLHRIYDTGRVWESSADHNAGVRPTFFLKSSINLTGNGTNDANVYRISHSTTHNLEAPTYFETETASGKDVTIDYQVNCKEYTCDYSLNDGTVWNTVTDNQITLPFEVTKSFIARVRDKNNNSSISSYTVIVGNGFYADSVESGRYVYKGANPNNYICLDTKTSGTCASDDLYRIIAKEADGTLKVVKEKYIDDIVWDPSKSSTISGITNSSSYNGTRYTSTNTDYCYNSSYYGCNSWGSKTSTYDSTGNNKVTSMIKKAGDSKTYTLPTYDAYLNVYLNGGKYLNTSNAETTVTGWINSQNNTIKNNIVEHLFNVGPIEHNSNNTLAEDIVYEKAYKWKGKVGLINATDFVRASSYQVCTGLAAYTYTYSSNVTNSQCWFYGSGEHNWLSNSNTLWTISPILDDNDGVWTASSYIQVATPSLVSSPKTRPTFYLKSGLALSGNGNNDENVYRITSTSTTGLSKPTFSEKQLANRKDITITYPSGCTKYTCQYSINGGASWRNVTTNTEVVSFTSNKTLTARVTNIKNQIVTNSYNVKVSGN